MTKFDTRFLNIIDIVHSDLETLRNFYDRVCSELYLLRCECRQLESSIDDFDIDSEEYAYYDSLLNNIIFLSGFADRIQSKIMYLENSAHNSISSNSADTDVEQTDVEEVYTYEVIINFKVNSETVEKSYNICDIGFMSAVDSAFTLFIEQYPDWFRYGILSIYSRRLYNGCPF